MTRKAKHPGDPTDSPAEEVQEAAEVQAQEAPAKTVADLQRDAQREAALDELLAEAAADKVRLAEMQAKIDDLANELGRPRNPDEPATIHIRCKSLNQDVAAKAWATRVPGRKAEDAPKFAKTYKLTPVGASAKLGMPVAILTNAADPSDAKCHYALKLDKNGEQIVCNIERAESPEAT